MVRSMPLSLHPDDTIAALASAAGHAARGIVRVSGPETKRILEALVAPAEETSGKFSHPVPWCYPVRLKIGGLALPVLVDLYLWPNRKSYTGQPLAELHT